MKLKDLLPKVDDVHMAVVKEENELNQVEWNVYIINKKKTFIETVMLTSKGYGIHKGEQVKTSVLRKVLEDIPALSYLKVEMLPEDLHGLTNEFWLSFYAEKNLYDKKYIFLPETIKEANLTTIPVIGKKGILIE